MPRVTREDEDATARGNLAEYEFIREGLRQDQRERQVFLGLALAAGGLVLGLVVRPKEVPTPDEALFLVGIGMSITIVAQLLTIRATVGVASAGVYLREFVEPKVPGLRFQKRNRKFLERLSSDRSGRRGLDFMGAAVSSSWGLAIAYGLLAVGFVLAWFTVDIAHDTLRSSLVVILGVISAGLTQRLWWVSKHGWKRVEAAWLAVKADEKADQAGEGPTCPRRTPTVAAAAPMRPTMAEMTERIVRDNPASILVLAAIVLIATAITGLVAGSLAIAQVVLGAGLLLIAALLPRLGGQQKVGPGGIELNIDAVRLENAIERAAADEGIARVDAERLSGAIAAAIEAARSGPAGLASAQQDSASQLTEIAYAAVQGFANPAALRRSLERAILGVTGVLNVDVTMVGAHCWVLATSDQGEALVRVARARIGGTPPNPPRRWIKGRGTVGRCWERGEDVFDDVAGHSPDEAAAQRLGLKADEVQRTRRDFRAIWAAPMYAGSQFVGCISLNLDSDYHDPITDDTIRELRRISRDAAEDCSLLLVSSGSGGDT